MEEFLDGFQGRSDAERTWLREVFEFVKQHLGSTPDDSTTGEAALHLSLSLLRRIEETHTLTLPLSYRLVSVSELVARQHVACVSNVSWTTNQHKAWEREAESQHADHKALPRVHLLLIGYLREGQGGELRLTDASGHVTCQCVAMSPLWLDQPLFLPHWNYIPHNAHQMGLLELIGSPALLSPGQGLAVHPGGADHSGADGVKEAAARLRTKCQGVRMQLCGVVCSVSPLLEVSGTTFFFLILTDPPQTQTLPVLVQENSCLWWSHCVSVDQYVYVTALRVCTVRGWKGNRILCATGVSKLHILPQTHTPHTHHTHTQQPQTHTLSPHTCATDTHHAETHTLSPATHTQSQHTETQTTSPHAHTPHTQQHTETHTPLSDATEKETEQNEIVQSGVRMKHSRVISYQGVVTEVLSEEAGLYMIDGKVGLCLAYRPSLRRSLRTGDHLQIHDVHFLYQPCPDLPSIMLGVCLRSTVRVTSFSPLATPGPSPPRHMSLPRLLLKQDVGVSHYLWASHVTKRLTRSLVPRWLTSHSVCVVAWRILQRMLRVTGGGRRRDIYTEILEDPHTCPLSQYTADPLVCEYVCVSECLSVLESQCGSGPPLRSLLPPNGASLGKAQLNQQLAWSHTARPGSRARPVTPEQAQTGPGPSRATPHQAQTGPGPTSGQRPLVLVGVLELPDPSDTPHTPTSPHTLQLRDGSGCVACVITEPHEDGQRAVFNSAWIGCLVCVQRVIMVTERFLQSDFPSYTHLEQDGFIRHTHYRTYLQFCLSDVHILSPSVAMATHLQAQRVKEGEEEEEEEESEKRVKRVKLDGQEEESCSGSSQHPCVSVVMRVEQKEGVSWSNTGVQGEQVGLTLCFLVRAELIGPALRWGRDPRNSLVTDMEKDSKTTKVHVVYQSTAVRWFPVLQPNCFYRIVVPNTQDLGVLIGSVTKGQSRVALHAEPSLQVGSDWTFHTLTMPDLLYSQCLSPRVMSVSELLDSRSAEMVCFQGVLSQRISLPKETNTGNALAGDGLKFRLSICDQSGRSVHVYLDLSHAPYPPGLLPGNTLLLSSFHRKQSRSGSVYCNSLPVSCVTVSQLGDSSPRPPSAPIMQLMDWMQAGEKRCIVGRVRGHVVCVLFLQLNWICSLCDSTFIQSRCSRPQCNSTTAVFHSTAKIVLEDGTGEAHVWFSSPLVCPLLGLADSQWEELQRALRVRGCVRIYSRSRGLVCEDTSDCLLQYLNSLCSSSAVCRPLKLTCRANNHTPRAEGEARRFSRGETDFITRMFLPLQLNCTHIEADR